MDKQVSELAKAGEAVRKANEGLQTAFNRFMAVVPGDVSGDEFWDVVEHLKKLITRYKGRGSSAFESATRELIRDIVVDGAGTPAENYLMAANFTKAYQIVVGGLYKKLSKLPGVGRSDDSYGDLIDSLPLAGPEVIGAIESGDIANGSQLEDAIPEDWRKAILDGENYIRMGLEDGLLARAPFAFRDRGED